MSKLSIPRVRRAAPWRIIPNEIRQMIYGNFDLRTALLFSRSGTDETLRIQNLTKHDVFVSVKYVKKGVMVVELMDLKEEKVPLLTWKIISNKANSALIKQTDSNGNLLYSKCLKKTSFSDATFRIIGILFSKPMFRVKKLQLDLFHFNGNANFGRKVNNLEELVLKNCRGTRLFSKIASNFEKFPKKIYIDHVQGYTIDEIKKLRGKFPENDAREIYIGLTDLLQSTNNIFNGNSEFRDDQNLLNFEGFRKLSNHLLHLPLTEPDGKFHGYFLAKFFYRKMGYDRSRLLVEMASHVNNFVYTEYTDNSTSGYVVFHPYAQEILRELMNQGALRKVA